MSGSKIFFLLIIIYSSRAQTANGEYLLFLNRTSLKNDRNHCTDRVVLGTCVTCVQCMYIVQSVPVYRFILCTMYICIQCMCTMQCIHFTCTDVQCMSICNMYAVCLHVCNVCIHVYSACCMHVHIA